MVSLLPLLPNFNSQIIDILCEVARRDYATSYDESWGALHGTENRLLHRFNQIYSPS